MFEALKTFLFKKATNIYCLLIKHSFVFYSHLSAAHSDEFRSEISACEFCGKVFKDKSNLRKHRYEHIGAPYNCKSCGHGFGRKDFLENHEAKCNMISKRTNIPFH